MKLLVPILLCACLSFLGCANHNTAAGNVATGAAINSVAGVPGAGVISLLATAVELISQYGRPSVGSASPQLSHHIKQSPGFVLKEDGTPHWIPRKEKGGHTITADNAPQRSKDYAVDYIIAVQKFCDAQFGDTPEMQQKNLKAWKDGKAVVAEYHGSHKTDLVIVSVNREPAEAMTAEEWVARNTGGTKGEPINKKESISEEN